MLGLQSSTGPRSLSHGYWDPILALRLAEETLLITKPILQTLGDLFVLSGGKKEAVKEYMQFAFDTGVYVLLVLRQELAMEFKLALNI